MYPTGKGIVLCQWWWKFKMFNISSILHQPAWSPGQDTKTGTIPAKSGRNGEPCLREGGRVFRYYTNVHTSIWTIRLLTVILCAAMSKIRCCWLPVSDNVLVPAQLYSRILIRSTALCITVILCDFFIIYYVNYRFTEKHWIYIEQHYDNH
jgi:hypothetical protein